MIYGENEIDSEIYVLIFFPFKRQAVAMNRAYHIIPDADWESALISDVVESSEDFFPPGIPDWAVKLKESKHYHVTFWLRERG